MRTIGCEAALIAVLFAAPSWGVPVQQRGNGSVDNIKPYPGSIAFCTQHITGAPEGDGKAGPHISWTGYYSVDSPRQVVRHYTKLLGAENHRTEGKEDIWRFPFEKPERILTVTQPRDAFVPGDCTRPPGSARAIVITSMMTRPD
jgi:hypothetical protein